MRHQVSYLFAVVIVVGGVEITFHTDDVLAVVEDKASLSCGVERNRNNRFSNCSWVGPSREVVWAGGSEDRSSVFLERDQEFYYCVLEITSLELGDEGAWNCIIKSDDGNVASNTKFIFVDIRGRDGPEILQKDNFVASVDEGENATLICPTSIRPRSNKDRPTCIWFGPAGKKYDIIGSQGEIYVHEKEGITSAGDIDKGDCGIEIREAMAEHRGSWSCRISTEFGQNVVTLEKNVTLEVVPKKVLVTKPLNSGQMTFSVDIVRNQDDQIHNVYWILRRRSILMEGRTVCFAGRSECVTSSNLKQMTVKDDKIHYQMKISYEAISQEDSEDPVVLVVEWRDAKGDDKSEHIFLDEVGSSSRRISRVIGGMGSSALCGSNCKVDGKKMLDGEVRKDNKLCIYVRCDGGEVVIEKLKNCDESGEENNVVVFPGDFS